MQDPTETVNIHTEQNFVVDGGLSPVKIELEDDLNILKKHKSAKYKLTPLGFLFPASVKNNT